jgi:Iap family predicted aminopeptidase
LNFKLLKPAVTTRTLLALLLSCTGAAQTGAPAESGQQNARPAVHSHRPVVREGEATTPALCASCVRDNLNYLAGPELHGRGSGTQDEYHAAQYIAEKLETYGLAPGAGDGQFIQTATVRSREVLGNPTLTVEASAKTGSKTLVLTHGKQIAISGLYQSPVSASLQKLDLAAEKTAPSDVNSGAAVLVRLRPGTSKDDAQAILDPIRNQAALVIVASTSASKRMFDVLAKHPPQIAQQIGDQEPKVRAPLVLAKQEAFDQLWAQPDGTPVTLRAQITPWKDTHTWNVLARIEGTDEKDQIVLLSAHLDHLGVENGQTYYGADDDASGTATVMELARLLAKETKPKRTIFVALWGSEEEGMVGSRYFLRNPTFPLKDIVANLEFEMVGRPDPKLRTDELWLSGFDRTNLGPELAQHGAKLVADPHPAEKFFTRSDNFALAKEGIVAQTVSSYGLHEDYHQPTDTADKIDFQHMDSAITSMIGPIKWLANTDFTPKWAEGKKP